MRLARPDGPALPGGVWLHDPAKAERGAMFQLVYISSASDLFSKQVLLDLLEQSRENNRRDGLTGLLLYKEGSFMQALEGEEAAVRRTHGRIERDPRHRGLLTILMGPVQERRFGGWSMGFRDLKSPELAAHPGFSRFLETPLTGQEFSAKPAECERLLLTFKKIM